jgi:hypothetical protein
MKAAWLFTCLAGLTIAAAPGCSGGDDDGGDAGRFEFPEDYLDTYTMARDCRKSGSHDLHYIVVWTDPDATGPYIDRDAPIPVGSIILKEEYDFADTTCEEGIVRWSAMKRLPAGEAPDEHLDNYWERFDIDGDIASENDSRCWGCHDDCDGDPTRVYEHTCADP